MKQPSSSSSIETVFNITVKAIDQHNQSLSDQTNIELLFYNEQICLENVNQTIFIFNTTEHEIIPYELGQIHLDNCSLLLSKSITYHLINNNHSFPFTIDIHTGIIKVIHELDREKQSFYRFNVNLFDNLTIQTEVQINILDKNDHYPRFNLSYEKYIYISINISETKPIFLTNIYAIDYDLDSNGYINYYFINKDLYNYFHLYSNGSIFLYNFNSIHLPISLEIYAQDYGYPNVLNSKEILVIYICDLLKKHECLFNKLQRNFYLCSMFMMIFILSVLLIIILCIFWNLLLKKQYQGKKHKLSINCHLETKNKYK